MNFKFKNKKVVIFAVIIVLVLIIGGVFWWEKREIKGSPDDYTIKETEEGKIVENKKAGLTVKAPEGWEVKKIELLEGSVVFATSNIEGIKRNDIINPPLKNGCMIETVVVYKKMNLEGIKEEITEIHVGLGVRFEHFEEVTIGGHQALRDVFDSELLGSGIVIYIPSKNKLYNFSLNWASEEKEKCVQEFEKFLETVEIK